MTRQKRKEATLTAYSYAATMLESVDSIFSFEGMIDDDELRLAVIKKINQMGRSLRDKYEKMNEQHSR